MKIEMTISEEEVKKLLADHLAGVLGCEVNPSDITRKSSYGHDYTLGAYGGFEYPPIPKPATVPAAPDTTAKEVMAASIEFGEGMAKEPPF